MYLFWNSSALQHICFAASMSLAVVVKQDLTTLGVDAGLQVFLEGLAATMRADADFKGGWYDPQKPPTVGPRAFARVYAGWGFSQPFYWEKVCFLIPLCSSSLPCH